ncbi:hypothetical protein KAR91_59725 [Candidatus Pacearchaeota archaeon]|nr:hypothetical protein [Candidatus Pacearchaeota archaeon]
MTEIIELPKFKKKDIGRHLTLVRQFDCKHTSFEIDEAFNEVTCCECGAKMNPMFILLQMAKQETRFSMARKNYIEEQKRLSERSRTKCQHCGKMTRISRS